MTSGVTTTPPNAISIVTRRRTGAVFKLPCIHVDEERVTPPSRMSYEQATAASRLTPGSAKGMNAGRHITPATGKGATIERLPAERSGLRRNSGRGRVHHELVCAYDVYSL